MQTEEATVWYYEGFVTEAVITPCGKVIYKLIREAEF